MKVALTGASGFLGHYLTKELLDRGHQVRALVRESSRRELLSKWGVEMVPGDLHDVASLEALVDGTEVVLHNALEWVNFTESPREAFETNVGRSLDLLEFARKHGRQQFIFVSSIAALGAVAPDIPLSEIHPIWPDTIYGTCKAMVDDACTGYHHVYGMNTSSWRPALVYGVDMLDPKRATWRNLILSVARGEPFSSDEGGSVNSMEDTAHAIVLAVGNPAVAGQQYNVVDCYCYKQQVAQFAKELSGSSAVIEDRIGAAEPRFRVLSDKARALGARLNRGLDGVREHVRRVLELSKGEW
ncbi:MAG: epimerase [Fimbriimonadales bacterium]